MCFAIAICGGVLVALLGIPPADTPDARPAAASSSGWGWPLDTPTGLRPSVVREFDPPAQPWLAGHRGADLAARPGRRVLAAGAGTVSHVGRVAGWGVVAIDHLDGLRTTYLPVDPSVRSGKAVDRGDPIGTIEDIIGETVDEAGRDHRGHCPASCLHWGLLRGGVYLDPLLLVGAGRVRLLPRWTGGPGQARGWAWR
jgi:murein DD-endopeptidase MepM/ murein hydrolase activator NlpD